MKKGESAGLNYGEKTLIEHKRGEHYTKKPPLFFIVKTIAEITSTEISL